MRQIAMEEFMALYCAVDKDNVEAVTCIMNADASVNTHDEARGYEAVAGTIEMGQL
jgi:hypothetical protein